jgi:serine/threonine-protein kinase
MQAQARPTLTVCRTLQTLGPAPPTLASVRTDRPSALRGVHLGGRYRLDGLIAEGATSWVYRGRHLLMDQDVAVKVLRPDFCAHPAAVERFLDEARTLARLRHPNIVTVHDFDRTDERAWMVMELLEGETLAERRERVGRLTWSSVRRIVLQLCSAIRSAHDEGILHRDIKPENCVCLPGAAEREFIKIVDFGIASLRVGDHVANLEPKGCIAGTPAYMAPERMLGRGDERSDIYSTGVLMYELLTGTLPFVGTFPSQRQGIVEPPSVRAKWCCNRAVDQVVLEAIANDPADRFQSMREFASAIRRAGQVEPRTVAVMRTAPRSARSGGGAFRPAAPPVVKPSHIAVPLSPRRTRRSRLRGLLSLTAVLTLALGLSPIGAGSDAIGAERVGAEDPAPGPTVRQAMRAPRLHLRYSTPAPEPPFPAALARFASQPWRSDCTSVADR